MTEYNNMNMKLTDLQLDKLKWAPRITPGATLRLSSNMIGINKSNFPHISLLTGR